MPKLTLTDAEGRIKEFRSSFHTWGALNPFQMGTVGIGIGTFLGFVLRGWLG